MPALQLTTMTVTLLRIVLFAAGVHAYALPKVVIFSTGGTISGKHDPVRGGYVPALSGSDLVAAVPKLKEIADVQVEQVATIDSADMTPEVWLRLANGLRRVLNDTDVSGAVVTHGTNTLEETAYFLDLVIGSPKPVILVGAQRPLSPSAGRS